MDGVVVGPGEVTLPRPLDLDDAGAEVREVTGGQRAGDGLFDRHDRDPLERERPASRHRAVASRVAPRMRPPPMISLWISLVPS